MKFIADQIRYKKPALINVDQIESNIGNMFVLPVFLPPSKHDFLIRTPLKDEEEEEERGVEPGFNWYYRRCISDIR